MKDIKIISGDYQQNSFEVYPETIDRLRACRYFCDKTQEYATSNDDTKAKWYFRAAISGFSTTLETINNDVKRLIGSNTWCDSEQKKEMYENTLIKVLTKTRNFSVHSDRIKGEIREYSVTMLNGDGESIVDMRSLFFEKLCKSTNIKGVSKISVGDVEWFNKQSERWPVNLLIRSSLFEASKYVHHFTAMHKIG